MKDLKQMCRRDFVKESAIALCGGMFLAHLQSCGGDSSTESAVGFSIDLTDPSYSSLSAIGGSIVKNGIVVIRTSVNEFAALSNRCTHQACTVNYSKNSDQLVCPCHGSKFSNSGNVIQGPATKSLSRYSVEVSGNILAVNTGVLI